MISFRPSAILPSRPVQSKGMRAVKSPALTSLRTRSSTPASNVSVSTVPLRAGELIGGSPRRRRRGCRPGASSAPISVRRRRSGQARCPPGSGRATSPADRVSGTDGLTVAVFVTFVTNGGDGPVYQPGFGRLCFTMRLRRPSLHVLSDNYVERGYRCRVELLERDGALATLAAAYDAAADGDGRVVFVTGEPGIGKTSLVHPLPARPRRRGARALRYVRRPLHPAAARTDPRPRRQRLAGARRGARRGRRAARRARPADRGARAAAAADGARAGGRALGRRCDVRRHHGARPPRRRRCRRCWCSPSAAARRRPATACTPSSARSAPTTRCASTWRRCRRAPWRRWPAPTRRACTPRRAATRSTSPSCWPRAPPTSCRRRSRTPSSAARRAWTTQSRRLVELVSVVPPRTRTSVLDAVMPGWTAAAMEPERRQLLQVESRVRALPPRARPARDPLERAGRGAAAPPRRDPRGAARQRRRPRRHRPPRRGGGRGGRRGLARARRGAARGGDGVEPPRRTRTTRGPATSRTGWPPASRRSCWRSWRWRRTWRAALDDSIPARSSARSRP